MPVYAWEGKTARGESRKGSIRADSEIGLRTILRRDGVILTKAREEKKTARLKYNPNKKIKSLSIVIFTRQLATMISSGLPLVQSLAILANQTEDKNLKGIVGDIKDRIEGGSSFADALKQYPKCFDSLFLNLVVAGEEGGNLDTVLLRLANYMEKSEKLKKKVQSAMIYPISIVVVAVAVILVLLLFVIPVFEALFKDVGAALPAPTQMVIQASRFVKSTIHFILVGLALGIFLLRRYHKTEGGARQIDRMQQFPVNPSLLTASGYRSCLDLCLSRVACSHDR
jgi:type IV pilus assembly protein PilC